MQKRIIATAGLMLLSASVAQAGFVTVESGRLDSGGLDVASQGIAKDNDFASQLAAAGVTGYAAGSSLGVDSAGWITYYYLGKEAGFTNSFTAGDLDYSTQGAPTKQNRFGAPIEIGRVAVSAGVLDFGFCASGPGSIAAGCVSNAQNDFLNPGLDPGSLQSIAMSVLGSTAWLFWDDSGSAADSDHDDMVVKAVFTPGTNVPEPNTLALFGVGLIGLGMGTRFASRRKRHR